MIRRLDLTSDGRLHQREWADPGASRSHLLDPRKPFRKIVVMVDSELMDVGLTPSQGLTKRQLLLGLLQHNLVRLYRYADDGPPPEAPAMPQHPDLHEGWAVVTERDPVRQSWGVVHESVPGAYGVSGVTGNGGDVAAQDRRVAAYPDLDSDDAASRRRADWLAAQVASQALGADLYITERAYLHLATRPIARGTTICGVSDALPMLGLYFRLQDEYPIAERMKFNRGLFFWVGTRELLPEAWRWLSACVQHAGGAADDSLFLLGSSMLQRVQRALEARDAVHLALNQPQNHDTQDSALSHLDTTLLLLMAAIDVAARVAHRVVGMAPKAEYGAAWQNQRPGGWLDRMRDTAPALVAVVDAGTTGSQVLTILRLLRNSVHGAALQGLAVMNAGAPLENVVGLPPHDAAKLLCCMDALGSRRSWGVKETLPDEVCVDPGVFVDRLFDEVLILLNALMAKTPVELLNHVTLSPPDCQAPPDSGRGVFGDPFDLQPRTSIRWQLGF